MNKSSFLTCYIFLKTIALDELISMGSTLTFLPSLSSQVQKNERETTFFRASYNLPHPITEKEYSRILEISEQKAQEQSVRFKQPKASIFNILLGAIEDLIDDNGNLKGNTIHSYKELQLAFGQDLIYACLAAKMKSKRHHNKLIKNGLRYSSYSITNRTAENHAHLHASGPVFPLLWIGHMTNPRRIHDNILKSGITERRLVQFSSFKEKNSPVPIAQQVQLAALIRFYLIRVYKGKTDDPYFLKLEKVLGFVPINTKILGALYSDLISGSAFENYLESLDYNSMKISWRIKNIFDEESKFLFRVLKAIFENRISDHQIHLFHLYNNIKLSYRAELIQENNKTGFTNFQLYQVRKNQYLKEQALQAYLDRTYQNYNRNYHFEARISPGKNLIEDLLTLSKKRDNKTSSPRLGSFEHDPKTSIVVHFLKQADQQAFNRQPRNLKSRNKAAKEAEYIINFLKEFPQQTFLVGIDAASSESDCRPEVYGPIFRRLSKYIIKENPSFQLFKTFHVGEEFSDITDGLRAIFEAIEFLELGHYENKNKSDRLGHALAAGIDVDIWYKSKKNTLRKRRHDHLDDLAFLIHVLFTQSILHKHNWLVIEFQQLFSQLYGSANNQSDFENWSTYWKAFQLRGDCPETIFNKDSHNYKFTGGSWNKFQLRVFDHANEYRENPDILDLYKRYHYDKDLRKNGAQLFDLEVDKKYLEVVLIGQKFMIDLIEKRKIGIEANPTSNLKISIIDGYENHPIFRWTGKDTEVKLNVSINTDDAGVFDTDLRLEHALIHDAALRNSYSTEEALELINTLIENGRKQVFRNN